MLTVPFHLATVVGGEAEAAARVIAAGASASEGEATRRVEEKLARRFGAPVLLTTSCTDALVLALMLLDVGPGDEVIIPSYTFVSTALAVVDRGATPVFADVDPQTLGLDPTSVESALSPRTRVILPVHYGGIAAAVPTLQRIADDVGAVVVEDAAHGIGGALGGRPLGSIGALGALSFHHQKNIQSGEGGALVVNESSLRARSRVMRSNGTNRSDFLLGRIDRYGWIDRGGKFAPSDSIAAALEPQVDALDDIQARRRAHWEAYLGALREWAQEVGASLPVEPHGAYSSSHIMWIRFASGAERGAFAAWMGAAGIGTAEHYPSLARSSAGQRWGRSVPTPVSDAAADDLLRLPIYDSLSAAQRDRVIERAMAWRPSTPRSKG